jgi:hypothetical protein
MGKHGSVGNVTRWVEETWVAVTMGYRCVGCGHTHHGRQLHRDGRALSHVAIMYGFCDEDWCGCWRLQLG